MDKCYAEKRRFKRVFFTLEDSISLTISNGNQPFNPFKAELLSIGEGGLGFAATRVKSKEILVGDCIKIKDLQIPEPIGLIEKAELIVKYIINHDIYIRISFGCEFTDISNIYRERIKKFVRNSIETIENP